MRLDLVVLLVSSASGLAAAPVTRSTPPAPTDAYVGVACRSAGTNCGRVGVAVWLPRAADHVVAGVSGTNLRLATTSTGSGAYAHRRFWTGFDRVPARWIRPGSLVRLRITVTLGGVSRIYTRSAYLSAGWG